MDFIKKASESFNQGEESNVDQRTEQNQRSAANGGDQTEQGGGGFLSGIGDKLNAAAGGGKESEKNEDYLDKGIDVFQQKVLGQGAQDNESAVEQAKDEQISDFIRGRYKESTGNEFPVTDKETKF